MAAVVQDDAADIRKWSGVIESYERQFKKWEGRTDKIIKRYKDDRGTEKSDSARFNIFWSNVQTCMPAVYARVPKADVSRRFRDNDPAGRVASLMLERGLEFEIEHYPDYRAALRSVVFDRFMGGRGVAWVRYDPTFKPAEPVVQEDGTPEEGVPESVDEQGAAAPEEIDNECSPVDYVHWKDFGHSIARTWEEVTAVWRRVYMARPGLIERFGEELGKQIPLDTRPSDQKRNEAMAGDVDYQACIFEIWDKETRQMVMFSKSMNKILEKKDDPLGLENFWPCPKPLYATLTTDDLEPTPDFTLYQDQARELDVLSERIEGLIQALQIRGVYDGSIPELCRLFTEAGNNELIAVKNWMAFSEKNGLKGAIDIVDIGPIAKALNECYMSVEKVKEHVYEIMGVADIQRGSTSPYETLGAQKIKSGFGGLRLRAMQSDVVAFATELMHIKAQIMCKHYQPETLVKISAAMQLSPQDQQLIPQAVELLTKSPLRDFRIEVSSDSMVQMDEDQEKTDRLEFLKAVGLFMSQAFQLVQEAPQTAPLAVELMKFGVTGFKVGKTIEGAFDEAIDKLKMDAANPQQKPDPEAQKAQAAMQQMQMQAQIDSQTKQQDMRMEQQRMQMEAHFEQQRQRDDMVVEQNKQRAQAMQNEHQNQLEAQRSQLEAQNEAMLEKMRMQHEAALASQAAQLELLITRLDNATKVEVAEVTKAAQLERAQIMAASAASKDDAAGAPDGQTQDNLLP